MGNADAMEKIGIFYGEGLGQSARMVREGEKRESKVSTLMPYPPLNPFDYAWVSRPDEGEIAAKQNRKFLQHTLQH
jgi:hypothetical protein